MIIPMRTLTTNLSMGLFLLTLFSTYHEPVVAAMDEREVLYWVAPMDANYRRDKPGKSPMGMALVPKYADEMNNDGPGVRISPAVIQNLGVRTAIVERSRLWRGINTVGYVDYDESMVSHLHMRTEGWIEHLATHSEGDRVSKGDTLIELYSPGLVNAQSEFVQALDSGNKRLIGASRDRLTALGVPRDQVATLEKTKKVQQTIAIHAPQDGVVSHLAIRHGMYVTPDKQLMTLADLSSVWLLAEVFESQSEWVKVGNAAEVRLSFLPGRVWKGTVEYIYPSLDPMTRTLKVRLRFQNPDEALKPNMYASVKIFGGAKSNILVLPTEALIRTGHEERVVVALGDGRFDSRIVRAGMESGDWIEIIDGLSEGDEVVVSGQFLIDSEASLKASMARMMPSDDDGEM